MSAPIPVSDPPSPPVSPAVVEMARQAVRDFHECFWFRHPEADIADAADVRLVIRRLREHGGHRGWERAQQIVRCR